MKMLAFRLAHHSLHLQPYLKLIIIAFITYEFLCKTLPTRAKQLHNNSNFHSKFIIPIEYYVPLYHVDFEKDEIARCK